MKAAVYKGMHEIEITEVPEPEIGPRDVLIRPAYVGICGTDLSAWEYGMFESGVIIGHEFSGKVIEVGNEVENLERNDLVAPNSVIPCLECEYCRNGRHALCSNMQMIGISTNGGFAEMVSLPDDIVHKLPENADLKAAAMIEPLSIVIHGFNRIPCDTKTNALVLGAGPIGLLSLLYAKYLGFDEVYVSEINQVRNELASKLGATQTINPSKEPLALTLSSITQNRGVDLIIECTGAPEPSAESFSLVNRGGKILVLGISEEPVLADFMTGVLNELSIHFSYLGYLEFPKALSLITSRKVDVSPLITKVIRLENLVEEGFETLSKAENEDVKILVEI